MLSFFSFSFYSTPRRLKDFELFKSFFCINLVVTNAKRKVYKEDILWISMEYPNKEDLEKLSKKDKIKVLLTLTKEPYLILKEELKTLEISFSDIVDGWVTFTNKRVVQELKEIEKAKKKIKEEGNKKK